MRTERNNNKADDPSTECHWWFKWFKWQRQRTHTQQCSLTVTYRVLTFVRAAITKDATIIGVLHNIRRRHHFNVHRSHIQSRGALDTNQTTIQLCTLTIQSIHVPHRPRQHPRHRFPRHHSPSPQHYLYYYNIPFCHDEGVPQWNVLSYSKTHGTRRLVQDTECVPYTQGRSE